MSIYADLKLFVAHITSTPRPPHTVSPQPLQQPQPPEQPITHHEVTPDTILERAQVYTYGKLHSDTRATTIETVVANILPPLTPLLDANGYIHDNCSVAAKCSFGHIHRYIISDVICTPPRCTTCSKGNSFSNLMRTTAESILQVPFMINEGPRYISAPAVEYVNPVLRVVLVCMKRNGSSEPPAQHKNSYRIVHIHRTSSQRKIRATLRDALIDYPLLSDDQRTSLDKPSKKHTNGQIGDSMLPYTVEMATILRESIVTDTSSMGPLRFVTNSSFMCIEDC